MTSKLVRDRVPERIRANGKRPIVDHVTGGLYKERLWYKLDEELDELRAAEDGKPDQLIEIVDVIEVLYALAEHHGWSNAVVDAVRRDKLQTHGGFKQGVVWFGNADEVTE